MTSCMVALALYCACGAAEPMEASFCDVYPLAVGNTWYLCWGADACLLVQITGLESSNGYPFWSVSVRHDGLTGSTYSSYYCVFVDGWLYETPDRADIQKLPAIGGQMRRALPDTFRDNEAFKTYSWFGAATDLGTPFTPVVRSDRVELHTLLDLGQGPVDYCLLFLNRGTGMEVPGIYTGPPTIVGTCSVVYPAQISTATAPWVEVGHALRLAVPPLGLGFQWYKDGAAIEDASTSTYLKAEAELEDAGSYTCRIWDAAKAFHDTRAVVVKVVPEGSLPVVGAAGLAALALVLTAVSYFRIRKLQRH